MDEKIKERNNPKENDYYTFAYISDIKNTISINFTDFFNISQKTFNYFNIGKKRSYCKIKEQIIASINDFFNLDKKNNNSKCFINYFKLKVEIDMAVLNNKKISFSKFENMIKTYLIHDKNFINIIDGYINDIFIPILDQKVAKSDIDMDSIEKGLQFTDKHSKIISKIVTAIRIVIPLLTHFYSSFFEDFKENDYSIEEFLLGYFEEIIEVFSKDEVDLTHKFYKLVESRTNQTKYSDHVMWYYLENQGIDENIATDSILRKIFVDIFPKIELNKSPISFIHTIIKNQIEFIFKYDYPIKFKTIDLNQTDSEGISEFDKIEINSAKIDESTSILTRIAIKNIKDYLMKKYDITITEDEFNFYSENLHRNSFQLNLIFLFFAKYFNNYKALYNCTDREYKYYCILFKKIMDIEGLTEIAEIILGNVDEVKNKRTMDKKTLTKITDSKIYQFLVNKKYDSTFINLMESNLLIHYFAVVNLNEFKLVSYERRNELNTPIKTNINVLFSELLTFISMI